MTHIATFPTKKGFKAAVDHDPDSVFVDDPSIFSPVSGSVKSVVEIVGTITVTNHPKRSWFASVTRKSDGTFKVE